MSVWGRAVASSLGMFQISLIFGLIKLLETSEALPPHLLLLDNVRVVVLCFGGTMLGTRLHGWWSAARDLGYYRALKRLPVLNQVIRRRKEKAEIA